ncbi:hypothetical protein ACFWC5_39960 [Streptomyces sp. NPDC060085]|uniref:hypothetical protein n=1 Tax=Streptomyces sp. NPDC060085 TaxID=3347054 RepID=UPI00364B8B8F
MISPVHILAVTRGPVEEARDPLHTDRYRYLKSLFGADLHEAAVRCGLVEQSDRDLRATATGADLYERHLRWLPNTAANYWHEKPNPHLTEAIAEIERLYDQATDTSTL